MTASKILVYLLFLFFFAVHANAQTTIFIDEFNGTNLTDIASRSPDTGTGWTEVIDTTGTNIFDIANSTRARPNSSAENATLMYIASPAPTSADASIEFSFPSFPTNATDDPIGVVLRYQDTNNYYALVIYNDVSGTSNVFISKKVAGTPSDVASGTVSLNVGHTYTFSITGTSLSFYNETTATEILAGTDTSITSAGAAGIFSGSVRGQASDDTRNVWHFERVEITELPVSSQRRIWIIQ